ncbi:MAG TPA: MlaD family protein, partial [Blastocatellia bacterium]|nr:MlaD family protein [Blastocatellia bacterium]
MSKKKTSLSDLRVGLLVLGALATLVIFIMSVTGEMSPFAKRIRIKTRFTAAEGLKEGDEVRLAGKRVGKVEDVALGAIPTDQGQKNIVVTMHMDRSEVGDRIRSDSIATLGQQGFLGDRVIDISPGTAAADAVRDGGEIDSAPQAGLPQVFQGASDILVQFNAVGKQLEQLMNDINGGKGTIGLLLHDDAFYVNLNRTVLGAQDLVKRIREGNGTIPKAINDPKLYDDLQKITTDLQAAVADLRAGKGTAGKFLRDEELYRQAREATTKANSAIEKADRLIADVEEGRGTIGKLFKDEKLHNDLQASIASLRTVSEKLERG